MKENTTAVARGNCAEQSDACSPLELEARADELEAEALLLRAQAKRRRVTEGPSSLAVAPATCSDLDEKAAAALVGVSLATFRRARPEPCYFAGTRPRWRSAEAVRQAFALRGRAATTPESRPSRLVKDEDDIADLASRAGLRVVR